MKPPKPTEGVARHCWGKRRRIAKKVEKGLWKAMDRLGILASGRIKTEECFWTDEGGFHGAWIPVIFSNDGFDYWGESEESAVSERAHHWIDTNHPVVWHCVGDDCYLPGRFAKDDRHALQLLRAEIRARKLRNNPPETGL